MQSKAVSGLDWILEKFPFFHKSMYSAAHCSADSSKSHNPLRLVCFALFEKYLWKPDIARYMARHQYLEVRRLSCYPAICLHIKTNISF